MKRIIFLFGEAEKGEFCLPYHCRSLEELCDTLGNPPEESLGLHLAVQSLLFKRDCLFFRVKEEGFSLDDYFRGLKYLEKTSLLEGIVAVGLPGVGNQELLGAVSSLCNKSKSPLLLTERDFYDYITSFS